MNWRGPVITIVLALLWALTGEVIFGIVLCAWLLITVLSFVFLHWVAKQVTRRYR